MPLTKPNQQLRRDLKEAAALLKWSGVDLLQAAVKLSEAGQEDEAKELLKTRQGSRRLRASWRGMRKR
ncbi:hypothetical protein V5O39_04735 [Pseudomonas parakoreensis]